MNRALLALLLAASVATPGFAAEPVAIRADKLWTMAGPPIDDGVVVIDGGKIVAVGPAAEVVIPEGARVLSAAVATPGLIDARSVVGLAGWLNQRHDQEQLESSEPIQPELRAIDAYDAREPLIAWIRGFGVTTVHTGHAPAALVSGQTLIAKTRGETVEEAVFVPAAMVAATLGQGGRDRTSKKPPGTNAKAVAMVRSAFFAALDYRRKLEKAPEDRKPDRDLRLETLLEVLDGKLPLLVAAHRHQDIGAALRLQKEFGLRLVLDGAAESYLLLPEIVAAKVPVIVHATQKRPVGDSENVSFETASKLAEAGIPFAFQSGYEAYVPKTRVLLFEAAIAAANGLGPERALAAATIDAAKLLGIAGRVGSLEVGKDGDVALYDGDPFETTSHCLGVVIEGEPFLDQAR